MMGREMRPFRIQRITESKIQCESEIRGQGKERKKERINMCGDNTMSALQKAHATNSFPH